MDVSEHFYVEMAYGQRIYVCDMTSGHEFSQGIKKFSHPARLAVSMGEHVVPVEIEPHELTKDAFINYQNDSTLAVFIQFFHRNIHHLFYQINIERFCQFFADSIPMKSDSVLP